MYGIHEEEAHLVEGAAGAFQEAHPVEEVEAVVPVATVEVDGVEVVVAVEEVVVSIHLAVR